MAGTFFPLPLVSDPGMHHDTCMTHVPWCMPGSLTGSFPLKSVAGKTFKAFQVHAQPAILRIWQEAHVLILHARHWCEGSQNIYKQDRNSNNAILQFLFFWWPSELIAILDYYTCLPAQVLLSWSLGTSTKPKQCVLFLCRIIECMYETDANTGIAQSTTYRSIWLILFMIAKVP